MAPSLWLLSGRENRCEDCDEDVSVPKPDSSGPQLPLFPSHQTMHLMAKAAVAVYEAAVENCARGRSAEIPVEG